VLLIEHNVQVYYFLKKCTPCDFVHTHCMLDTNLRSCKEVSEIFVCNYTLKAHEVNFTRGLTYYFQKVVILMVVNFFFFLFFLQHNAMHKVKIQWAFFLISNVLVHHDSL